MAAQKPLLPLVLSVKATNVWRMNDAGSSHHDQAFQLVRTKCLERDDHRCRFCGFRAGKWQEVHHLNDDHADNRLENLVTACIYCHSVQHIGLAGSNREAVLAFIPEISQAQLHHVVRSIQVAKQFAANFASSAPSRDESTRASARAMGDTAAALEANLHGRTALAEQMIGTSDPTELADIIMRLANDRPDIYENRGQVLAGIRLLPLGRRRNDNVEKMNDIVASWSTERGDYTGLPPRSWVSLLKRVQAELGAS